MNFLKGLLGAVALALGLAAGGPASAQVKWDLPTNYGATVYLTESLQKLADDVEQATGGKFKIVVHANGSLFKINEIKRAVQTGQAQIGEVLISVLENENPLFGVDSLPFLATSYADAQKLWRASRPALDKALARQGMMLLYAVPWPAQGLYSKKPLNGAADLKGLKWRAYNPATSRLGELLGAQPVTIATPDLAQALATGAIDAFISSTPAGVQLKFWETMSHYYAVDAWVPKNMVIVNKRAFDALDKASQAALLKAAADAERRTWKETEDKSRDWLATHAKNGMQIHQPSPQLKQDFDRIGRVMLTEWLGKAGPDAKAVIDAYRK